MTGTSNSISTFLEEIHKLYQIGLVNSQVITDAMFAQSNFVQVDIPSASGSSTTITVPSFAYIHRRLEVFERNINEMGQVANDGGFATLYDLATGAVKRLYELSYDREPFINVSIANSLVANSAVVDNLDNPLNKLYTPNVVVKWDLTANTRVYTREVILKKWYTSKANWQILVDNGINQKTVTEALLLASNLGIALENYAQTLTLQWHKSRYNGKFSLLSYTLDNDVIVAKLDTLKYNDDANSQVLSRELSVGDNLAMLDHNTLLEVVSVNVLTNECKLRRLYGLSTIATGVSNMTFVDSDVRRVAHVPIRQGDYGFLSFAATHQLHGTQSQWSNVSTYSSAELLITLGEDQVSIDEYILANGGFDVSEYLKSLVQQSAIPIKYGIKPDKPAITSDMFNVVQINKHLVEGPDVQYIQQLYAKQQSLSGKLQNVNDKISTQQSILDTANYTSDADKKKTTKALSEYVSERDKLLQEYQTTITELSNRDIGLYANLYNPKYRIRGFWPVQEAIVSEFTRPQYVVKYEVQYRYVSANDKLAKSDNFDIVEVIDGDEITRTGSYSNWQILPTTPRSRVIDSNGDVQWLDNSIDNSEQININQLDVSITNNEQVDIRVRAISEVGYPTISLYSDWSETVRVKFPAELSTAIDFAKLESTVTNEKRKIELYNLLKDEGVIRHLQNAINQNNAYFAHPAIEIDSGFFTAELNKISLFDKLKEHGTSIESINNIIVGNRKTLTAVVIDAFGNEHKITNNATIKLFAGFYTQSIQDQDNGDIAVAQMYIRLQNLTSNTDVYSLSPGNLQQVVSVTDYDKGTQVFANEQLAIDAGTDGYFGNQQRNGQILYLRNRNVINNQELYEANAANATPHSIVIPSGDIVSTGAGPVYHIVGGALQQVTLSPGANSTSYIAVSADHPSISADAAGLIQEINALAASMHAANYANVQASAAAPTFKTKSAFGPNDKYLIGEPTVGAYLTVNPTNLAHVQVDTNAVDSYKRIDKSTDLLIPVVFQYRMTDALGRINGQIDGSSNTVYTKRIGIDMLLNGEIVKFDLEVTAAYSNNNLSTSTIPSISSKALENPRSIFKLT